MERKVNMSRILLAACLALFAGTSLGQMMAAPISTARYFPLVVKLQYVVAVHSD
jgi:hypothetical protein